MRLIMAIETDSGERITDEVFVYVEPVLGGRSLRDEARNAYVQLATEWAWTLYLIAAGRNFRPLVIDKTNTDDPVPAGKHRATTWPPVTPPTSPSATKEPEPDAST